MAEPVITTAFQNLTGTVINVSNGEIIVTKILAVNNSGAAAFVQFFDQPAASVVLGTTVPLFVIAVAPSSGFADVSFDPWPIRFTSRCSAASTTTPTGSVGSANGVLMQVFIS